MQKVTQEFFDTFMLECAKQGWMVDQVEIETLLHTIASKLNLRFDTITYQELMNRIEENE